MRTAPCGHRRQNSAIVPIDVDMSVSDSEIEISVVTSVATDDEDKKGYKLILPEDTNGEYTVCYRDPDGARHQIGKARIQK